MKVPESGSSYLDCRRRRRVSPMAWVRVLMTHSTLWMNVTNDAHKAQKTRRIQTSKKSNNNYDI